MDQTLITDHTGRLQTKAIPYLMADVISERLKEWKKITSEKWVLETVKGAKADEHNLKKVPLNDQNFSEKFSKTVIPLIHKGSNQQLNKGVIAEVSGMELGYLSPKFLRYKKENNHRLILNLKELNKFLLHHNFKMDTLKSAINKTIKRYFMVSIDPNDAYYSVPYENCLQTFFAFQF